MKRVILFLATGGGAGFLPWFPGSWGSVVGLLLFWPLRMLSPASYLITLIAFIVFSVWIASLAEALFNQKDCKKIVIDEVVGLIVAVSFVPFEWKTLLIGFFLFRLFDIWKPFPARWIQERVPAGWGIVGDDLIAGIYANLILQGVVRIL